MNGSPWLSVIIPTFNSERYLAECIDSVLAQTMPDFEVVCVDDGSTDKSSELLALYAARDVRVRYISQSNAGPGVARNEGLASARGEFVYCLDADDFVRPTMFALCKKVLQETKADMALMAFRTYNDKVQRSFEAEWSLRHEDLFPSYPQGVFSWHNAPDLFFETVQNVPWNKVVRKSLLDQNHIRFQELYLTEDLMYSIPAAVLARTVVRIPQLLVVHRELAGTNAMADKGKHPLDFLEAFEALQKWLHGESIYNDLRLAFQTWLLDAVYYNLPTYRDIEGFARAFDRLTADNLRSFDLAELDLDDVRDRRYRAMLSALRNKTREQFLLECVNIVAAEVQEQKCGFQDQQMSLKWLLSCLRERLRAR